jgi:signal peptidase II
MAATDRRAAPGLATLPATLLVAAIAFAFDRALKWWIVEALDLPARGVIDVASPWLRLTMAWNEGANFGLGAGLAREVWIAVALAISLGLLIWSLRMASGLRRLSVGLLVGGAVGNALDRALYGAVADFLNMSCCGIANPYAFNLADVFIFVGAAGLILLDGSDNNRGDGPERASDGDTR